MNTTRDNTQRAMPDVASERRPELAGALDWVGMDEIELPVLIAGGDGAAQRVSARVAAFVNLHRPDARGIHMSRLYLHLDRHLSAEVLTPAALRRLLRDFLDSHEGLSDRARVSVRFDHLVRRPALASGNSGWRSYPVEIAARLDEAGFEAELGLEVQYSSTCPASAALSRQLIQEQFARDFAEGAAVDRQAVLAWLGTPAGIVATPHSQRSAAKLRVKLASGFDFPITELIDRVEQALRTPVQTAVKREDEQAFALANGQNLMFCEDAARRVARALDADERIADYQLRVAHYESLHPHDAVAYASKGVAGGYAPEE
ncbi:GTP cyclohydrolase FolE2 [Dokdonella sp.]|uniref:GTP cyclohydrolase FolE2 n=1 Tax=Dokdonella sp. TaxID=2291710 RepID=UPI001AFD222F|nr:GTP cyclohydrolase FolE2 [Dokdonella sp.]MBO9662464.1 GTP cyclohydrolase I FolE2 [Dokdonella sp.]